MTYSELKELVDIMDENYNDEYLANKEVVIEYRDKTGHYHYYGIGDWKFNQCSDGSMDCLYLRCDNDVPCLEA